MAMCNFTLFYFGVYPSELLKCSAPVGFRWLGFCGLLALWYYFLVTSPVSTSFWQPATELMDI
jgi:hypothetical protein